MTFITARDYHMERLGEQCEHCDGEQSDGKVRKDTRRGYICLRCDKAFDSFEAEMQEKGNHYRVGA